MAISKCPECGETISKSLEQCIHCGCKLMHCPKCGRVNKASDSVCSECGYSFTKTVNGEVPKGNAETKAPNTASQNLNEYSLMTAEEAMESCQEQGFYTKKNFHRGFYKGFVIASIAYTVITLIYIIASGFKDFSPVVNLLIFVSVGSIFGVIAEKMDLKLRYTGIIHWKKVREADFKSIVESSIIEKRDGVKFFDKEKKNDAIKYVINAQLIDEGKMSQKKQFWMAVLDDFLGTIQVFLFIAFMIENQDAFFGNATSSSLFSMLLESDLKVLLVLIVIIAIVKAFTFGKIPKKEKEMRRIWVKDNLSDSIYLKYMSNIHND